MPPPAPAVLSETVLLTRLRKPGPTLIPPPDAVRDGHVRLAVGIEIADGSRPAERSGCISQPECHASRRSRFGPHRIW